jgi:hypothetical protein
VNQPVAEQRRRWIEVGASPNALYCIAAEQIQCEVDGWPAVPDMILQIGIQALIPAVEFGRHGQQEHVEIKFRQCIALLQPLQARGGSQAGWLYRMGSGAKQRPAWCSIQELVRLFLAHIEAAVLVGYGFPKQDMRHFDGSLQACVEPAKGRQPFV